MSKPPVPESGKLVRLSGKTPFVGAPVAQQVNPGCYPPGSECFAFAVEDLQVKAGFCDVHLLVLKLASAKTQDVDLRIEIGAADYAHLLFLTRKQKFKVQAGTSTLVGLDPQAAKAGQQFFVSGNTVTLSVVPKNPGLTVGVGKRSNHQGAKNHPRGDSR